jgi:hypothetical protein
MVVISKDSLALLTASRFEYREDLNRNNTLLYEQDIVSFKFKISPFEHAWGEVN